MIRLHQTFRGLRELEDLWEKTDRMNLLVLGATGGIGIEIVRQSIERGHAVTAFVRTPERLSAFAGRVSIVTGDVLNAVELAHGMRGHDVVLSAFGPRLPIAKSDAHLLRDFAASLTNAMHQAELPRAIVVSTAFLFKDAMLPPAHLFGRLFFPGVVSDATNMEATLRASGLDIVIVRPPQLKDKPHTGRFRVREDHLPVFGFSIPRADVADFMIETAENGAFRDAVVGVCS
jgi:putative NADH-flavin reductase